MHYVTTAFTHLELALKMLAAARDGHMTRASIKDGESITWIDGKSYVVLPDVSLETEADLRLAMENNVTIAFGAAVITLDACREKMGLKPPDPIESRFDQVVALICQIRNCFAHDMADPHWRIRKDRYKRVYDLGYKKIDLTNVDGKRFEYDDIDGLDTLMVLRERLLAG